MDSTKEAVILSFAEWLRSQGKSENTIKTYTGVLSQFYEYSKMKVESVETEHIQMYLDFLENSKKSSGTIEKHYMALSVFYKYLGKPQVMLSVERRVNEAKQEAPDSLRDEEQAALLKMVVAEGNLRNITIVYLLLHTGIRVSELCDLDCEDIVVESNKWYIQVRNAKRKIDRTVPLTDAAQAHLKNYLDSLKEQAEPLFISSYNQRMTPRSVQYLLKKYNVHPHKLRHTFCQRLIDNGVDVLTVSKLAGHKDLNMAKRYVRVKDDSFVDAIDQVFNHDKNGS
ncbi:tyrosine-type recombinase/integrase [Peribacillus asahii]|uniref:Tyrosine recombinase XerC-like protein n=1 Tax=Peribacillus asahii TaxID=228899 RepID=A0A3Q9RJH9_9BACI|nr:tyrosine-type recombinase/integrase [Peribacillus asahii]AZV41019.1 tyrosine recombinase XerC-like protein [Peribacillus asahii]USK85439.1 tyrosine-type recombinase/integrase [Peribacillus asahii]